jgi:hypothetical protein
MEQGDFFNTIDAKGEELKRYRDNAGKQEKRVLELFSVYRTLSPSSLLAVYRDSSVPLTSLRRAITTLTNKGFLIKTDRLTKGNYGMNEHVWTINDGGA